MQAKPPRLCGRFISVSHDLMKFDCMSQDLVNLAGVSDGMMLRQSTFFVQELVQTSLSQVQKTPTCASCERR